jgi:NAD-dependent deacetylase
MERDQRSPVIALTDDTWLLVLTGAGVSAESGIPTFRASDGLWENHPVDKVATLPGFRADPALVWRFYSERRAHAKRCSPNPGHLTLAAVERQLGDRFLLATQNVDGLHRKAGSQRIVEMHGSLWLTRCSDCNRPPFADEAEYLDGTVPGCKVCGTSGRPALLRPHIVWFGEMLDPDDLQRIDDFAQTASRGRFVFLAVGTSGVVYPAAGLVRVAARLGAETWLANAEPPENASLFRSFLQGKSGEILPRLFSLDGNPLGCAGLP